jgi:hypothetical protein
MASLSFGIWMHFFSFSVFPKGFIKYWVIQLTRHWQSTGADSGVLGTATQPSFCEF